MKIRTSFVYPPIPDRRFDWSAVNDDTYDGEGCPVGYGETRESAIADLLQYEDFDRRCRTGNRAPDDGSCQHCLAVEGERCRDPIVLIGDTPQPRLFDEPRAKPEQIAMELEP